MLRLVNTLLEFTPIQAGRVEAAFQLIDLPAYTAELAAEREQALAEATDAVRVRDEFLSIASHEPRSPVAAIRTVVQLLMRLIQRGALEDGRVERFAGAIEGSTRTLERLLEDLVDVTRLRSGRLQLRRAEVEAVELVEHALEQAQVAPHEHRLIFEAPSEPLRIDVDAVRVEQVLGNLLGNAIKYSPAGGDIVVSVAPEAQGVSVRVRDMGIGLPPGAAEKIFEPFGRASNARAQNLPCLGRGLYISRQIAEAHGGRLWAESGGEGLGTTFVLWFCRSTNGAAMSRAPGRVPGGSASADRRGDFSESRRRDSGSRA